MKWFSKGTSKLNIIQMNTNMNTQEKKKKPLKTAYDRRISNNKL